MSNITIQEEYILPSLGKVYGKEFDPHVKLRSMTVAEEMKRLTATDNPYKNMSDIIEACLETKLPVSVYDMCLGDYQYLLHKLRVVTYGPEYKLSIRCPYCGEYFDFVQNLDEIPVHEYDDSLKELLNVKLPTSGKTVQLSLQTPRDLDNIEQRKKQLKKQFPDITDDQTLMLNLASMIRSVDGQQLSGSVLEEFIKAMPLRDSTLILQRATKLNGKVGLDINLSAKCSECGNEIATTFRYTSEFFRPEID